MTKDWTADAERDTKINIAQLLANSHSETFYVYLTDVPFPKWTFGREQKEGAVVIHPNGGKGIEQA